MIISVERKTEQTRTVIAVGGTLGGGVPSDYYLDITDITCDMSKCDPRPDCQSVLVGACDCDKGHVEHVPDTPKWKLRYVPTGTTACELTFEWCELLWKLPPKQYDAILYKGCEPCARVRLALTDRTPYASDVTPPSGCDSLLI